MGSFFTSYPYFTGCLLGLFIFTTIVLLFRTQRRTILLGGLLAVPQAVFALFLVPRYWNPRLVAAFPIGLEDVLFMFICGGMAWVEASWPFRRRIVLRVRPLFILRGLLAGAAFAAGLFIILAALGFKNMIIPVVIMVAWALILIVVRRDLWPVAALATIQSFTLYMFTLTAMKFLWPAFFSAWTWTNLSGLKLWGIPFEEIAWGLAYGPFWGTTLAYLFEVEIGEKAVRDQGPKTSTAG